MSVRNFPRIHFTACVLLLFTACSPDDLIITPTQPVVHLDNQLSGKGADMGHTLFRQLAEEQPGQNILISPWSIQSAVMMAAEGAVGPAREELEAFLKFQGTSPETLRDEYQQVHASLTSTAFHPTVRSANAFFYDGSRVVVNASYIDLIASNYLAHVQNLSFGDPGSKDAINDWASQGTNGLIPNILEEPIPSDQIFYLLNALYIKSDWMHGFETGLTSDADFFRSSGEVISVPMMFDDRQVLYNELDGIQMVDLSFRDSTFSLSLIRPREAELSDMSWLDKLNPQGLDDLYEGLSSNRMLLHMPRLELHFRDNLIPTLKSMGVQAPFSNPPADFSGVSTQSGKQIALNPIIHEVVLKVDEKGAEGAAVTLVGAVLTSLPPNVDFDRPFVLCLRHIPTGLQLFLGLVDHPGN